MDENRKHELEKEITELQARFERALDEGVEFSALKKIWLDLKLMQDQWRLLSKSVP
jgi:hypothetical protein